MKFTIKSNVKKYKLWNYDLLFFKMSRIANLINFYFILIDINIISIYLNPQRNLFKTIK